MPDVTMLRRPAGATTAPANAADPGEPGWLFEFQAMASPCRIRLVGPDEATATRLAAAAVAEVRRIEATWSRYRSDSVISHINAAAGRGRSVTVLEPGDKLGVEMAHPRRARALFEARSHSVEFVTGAEVTSIGPDQVEYRVGGHSQAVDADNVVVARPPKQMSSSVATFWYSTRM